MKKIALIAALVMMVTVCLAAWTVAEDADVPVMSHEEYVAAELDTPVCIESYVQASQNWWAKDGIGRMTLYLQSEDGAYFAYEVLMEEEESKKLVPGTKIRLNGFKSEWSGEVEITDATYEILEADPFIAEAFDITDLLSSEDLISHQNEKITVKGAVVTAKKDADGNDAAFLYNWDGSGSAGNNNDLYVDITVGDVVYTFTVESYLCGQDSDVYKTVESLQIGDVVDIEGFLYWYNGANVHITAVTKAE